MNKRRSIFLPDQQWAALRAAAERREITIAELLRRIIDVWRQIAEPPRS